MAKKYTIELEAKADKAINGIEELKKEIQALNKQVVQSNKKTEDGLKDVEDASKATAKGLRGIGTAIKAIGIGLLLEAFNFFKKTIGENQQAIDFFNTTFEAMSLAFNDFINFITSNFGTVVDFFKAIFEDPLQSVKDLGTAIKNNIIERFESAIEVAGFLGTALKKLFQGDFAGALDAAKEAGKELIDVVTGVDDTFDKTVDIVKNVASATANYVKETIASARANVELNKQAEIARVLQQGLVETYDRQAEKLRQIRDDERNTLDERIKANNDLKAVLDEQEKAMLKQVNLQIKSAQAQYNKNKNQENYIALLEATQEREAVLAQIEGFRSEQLANDLALSREAFELQLALRQGYVDRAAAENEFNANFIQGEVAKLEATKAALQEETRLREQLLRDNLARTKLGTQAQIDATNELFEFQQQQGQKEKQLDRQITEAKLNTVSTSLGQIANLLGENSKFGKALAVSQAIIDTYVGANKALAQGGIFGGIAAAGVIATGIANVKTILSTQEPSTPSFASGSGGSFNVPSAPPAPPAFNVVGAAAGNQLADAIAGQQQRPVKAFVVSREVTSAQELDRNAIRDASI
jgi:hypothetical protein